MSSSIYTLLSTEITCIPNAIRKIAGKYFSNAHCNGATWLFILWAILHLIFDRYLHALLLKLKFEPYVRSRLRDSLWYFGFFSTALIYCWATLIRDEVELFNFKKMHVPSEINLSHQIVGHTLISTFYLHSSIWEGLRNGSLLKFAKYFCLAALCTSSYILRVSEIVYTLTGVIGLSEVATHLTRMFYCLGNTNSRCINIFTFTLFITTFGLFSILYVVVIPLTFVIPLGLKILSDYPNILLIFLYFNLLGWLTLELYQSVLFNFIDHWLYHKKKMYNKCPNRVLECSLFSPRDDESYNLQILRKEVKERQQEMISKRKPKNRSMLLQTLKCMVAIKRKISEKRHADQSDSDSEKSDEGVLIDHATGSSDNKNETDSIKFMDEDNEDNDEVGRRDHHLEDQPNGNITTNDENVSKNNIVTRDLKEGIERNILNLNEESPYIELLDEKDNQCLDDSEQNIDISRKNMKDSMYGDNNTNIVTLVKDNENVVDNDKNEGVGHVDSQFLVENDKSGRSSTASK